jgi:isopenicillin N synthase-like dioxygenase
MSFRVPRVDISAYVADGTAAQRAAVAAQIDQACREVGFVQVVGHGVPDEITAAFVRAMDAFFALDLETKKSYRTPPSVNRGYAPPRSESLSLSLGVESASRMNDFFEAFNVGATAADYPDSPGLPQDDYAENVWPDVEGFERAVSTYFAQAGRVARTLTGIFGDAHRVKPPVVDGTVERRRSAAYFHDGDVDAVIEVLPSCVDADHPALYTPVTVGEHIAAKLQGSRAGVSNVAARRESERVLSSRR